MPRRRRPHETTELPAGNSIWPKRCGPAARLLLAGALSPEHFKAMVGPLVGHAANVMAWLENRGHTVYDMERRLWRLTSGGVRFAQAAPKPRAKKKPPPRPVIVDPTRASLLLVLRRRLTQVASERLCHVCFARHYRPKQDTCSNECTEKLWKLKASASPRRMCRRAS